MQLLSGVVWLIRNGSIYINQSQATECDETQETGQEAEAPRAFFLLCFDLFTLCVQGGTHAMVCVGGSRDSSFSPFATCVLSIELRLSSVTGGTLSTEPPSWPPASAFFRPRNSVSGLSFSVPKHLLSSYLVLSTTVGITGIQSCTMYKENPWQ